MTRLPYEKSELVVQIRFKLSKRAGGRHQHTQSPSDGLCLIEREHYITGLSLPLEWGRIPPNPPLFTQGC